jgi:hypothetical protein
MGAKCPPIVHSVEHTEHDSRSKNMTDTMRAEFIRMRMPLEGYAAQGAAQSV